MHVKLTGRRSTGCAASAGGFPCRTQAQCIPRPACARHASCASISDLLASARGVIGRMPRVRCEGCVRPPRRRGLRRPIVERAAEVRRPGTWHRPLAPSSVRAAGAIAVNTAWQLLCVVVYGLCAVCCVRWALGAVDPCSVVRSSRSMRQARGAFCAACRPWSAHRRPGVPAHPTIQVRSHPASAAPHSCTHRLVMWSGDWSTERWSLGADRGKLDLGTATSKMLLALAAHSHKQRQLHRGTAARATCKPPWRANSRAERRNATADEAWRARQRLSAA